MTTRRKPGSSYSQFADDADDYYCGNTTVSNGEIPDMAPNTDYKEGNCSSAGKVSEELIRITSSASRQASHTDSETTRTTDPEGPTGRDSYAQLDKSCGYIEEKLAVVVPKSFSQHPNEAASRDSTQTASADSTQSLSQHSETSENDWSGGDDDEASGRSYYDGDDSESESERALRPPPRVKMVRLTPVPREEERNQRPDQQGKRQMQDDVKESIQDERNDPISGSEMNIPGFRKTNSAGGHDSDYSGDAMDEKSLIHGDDSSEGSYESFEDAPEGCTGNMSPQPNLSLHDRPMSARPKVDGNILQGVVNTYFGTQDGRGSMIELDNVDYLSNFDEASDNKDLSTVCFISKEAASRIFCRRLIPLEIPIPDLQDEFSAISSTNNSSVGISVETDSKGGSSLWASEDAVHKVRGKSTSKASQEGAVHKVRTKSTSKESQEDDPMRLKHVKYLTSMDIATDNNDISTVEGNISYTVADKAFTETRPKILPKEVSVADDNEDDISTIQGSVTQLRKWQLEIPRHHSYGDESSIGSSSVQGDNDAEYDGASRASGGDISTAAAVRQAQEITTPLVLSKESETKHSAEASCERNELKDNSIPRKRSGVGASSDRNEHKNVEAEVDRNEGRKTNLAKEKKRRKPEGKDVSSHESRHKNKGGSVEGSMHGTKTKKSPKMPPKEERSKRSITESMDRQKKASEEIEEEVLKALLGEKAAKSGLASPKTSRKEKHLATRHDHALTDQKPHSSTTVHHNERKKKSSEKSKEETSHHRLTPKERAAQIQKLGSGPERPRRKAKEPMGDPSLVLKEVDYLPKLEVASHNEDLSTVGGHKISVEAASVAFARSAVPDVIPINDMDDVSTIHGDDRPLERLIEKFPRVPPIDEETGLQYETIPLNKPSADGESKMSMKKLKQDSILLLGKAKRGAVEASARIKRDTGPCLEQIRKDLVVIWKKYMDGRSTTEIVVLIVITFSLFLLLILMIAVLTKG